MPAAIHSLLSEAEAKAAVKLQSADAGVLARLNQLAAWTSELCELIGETQFVERSASPLDEVHDLAAPQGFLQLRRRPIIGTPVVVVGDPGTTLDATNYHVDAPGGQILLKGGTANPGGNRRPPSMFDGNPSWVDFPEDYFTRFGYAFPAIVHSVVVTYRGGFANTAAVPGDLKRAAGNVLARWWREEERKSQGLTSEIAQGFTYATKFAASLVSDEDRKLILARGNLSRTARELPVLVQDVGTITGLVRDVGLLPIEGATVYACPSGLSATTIADGTFTIVGVPVGDVIVKAAKLAVGFNLIAVELTTGGAAVIVTISEAYQSPECG